MLKDINNIFIWRRNSIPLETMMNKYKTSKSSSITGRLSTNEAGWRNYLQPHYLMRVSLNMYIRFSSALFGHSMPTQLLVCRNCFSGAQINWLGIVSVSDAQQTTYRELFRPHSPAGCTVIRHCRCTSPDSGNSPCCWAYPESAPPSPPPSYRPAWSDGRTLGHGPKLNGKRLCISKGIWPICWKTFLLHKRGTNR